MGASAFAFVAYAASTPAIRPSAQAKKAPASSKPKSVVESQKRTVSFGKDVVPILKAHCYACHTKESASAKLDLTSIDGIKRGGLSGPVVTAGQPAKSSLLFRIQGKGGMEQMPKGFAPLSKAKQETIAKWIAQGAIYDNARTEHWAYVAPKRPAVPQLPSSWVRNPIDAFIYARLKKEGLTPSEEADPQTLRRRLHLDLNGLLPETVLPKGQDFDYEATVDALLARPQYGERMARLWLDLSRYADTDGYEKDLGRTAYLYRDYLIDSFNKNKPFNQFTIEQMAGDLLPEATDETRIATGFHRNSQFNSEGGVDQAEAHYQVLIDRVSTTSTVWLGSSVGCARCHDHKYDPFTQKDFFRMMAFFGNTVIVPQGDANVGEEKWREPTMKVVPAALKGQIAALKTRKTSIEAALKLKADDSGLAAKYREEFSLQEPLLPILPATVSALRSEMELLGDGSVRAKGESPDQDVYSVEIQIPTGATAVVVEVLPDESRNPATVGRAPGGGNFILSGLTLKVGDKESTFSDAAATFSQNGYDPLRTLANSEYGWAVFPNARRSHRFVAVLPRDFKTGTAATLQLKQESTSWPKHTIAKFRLFATTSAHPLWLAVDPEQRKTLLDSSAKSADVDRALQSLQALGAEGRVLVNELREVDRKAQEMERNAPSALVLVEKPRKGPLTYKVHNRGEWTMPGETVHATTPAFLGSPIKGSAINRLTLGRWLVSKDNPLTARVTVNRLWELLFGRGLVESSDDFGTQGSIPSHPELLDWLSVEFMDSGWDIKHILRLIVTSSTYRQSSKVTKALLAKDPANILLARGPRFRMEAESIRDVILQAGGVLSKKIGGPSVYPDQPDGVWNTPYSGERWMLSPGEDRYRRGIYTYIKRTAAHPVLTVFDGTSREVCTTRRLNTNTPLQALALLNDPAVKASAKSLAVGMAKYGSDREAITWAFERATARTPESAEISRLESLLKTLRERYSRDAASAAKLGSSAEDAAKIMLCTVLMNLDETITKE